MATLAEAAQWGDAAGSLTEREWAFVSGALANAGDFPLFLVLSDWLEEHGRTAEGARVRRLVPQPGEIVVATLPPDVSDRTASGGDESLERQVLSALTWAVRFACPSDVPLVVVLPHGADLQALDREEMRRLGWVRAERAAEARVAERERCRAVLRERMEVVRRFADEIAPVSPHAAELAGAEYMALFGAIELLLSDQAAPDVPPAGPEGAPP